MQHESSGYVSQMWGVGKQPCGACEARKKFQEWWANVRWWGRDALPATAVKQKQRILLLLLLLLLLPGS
jgi:hypothetical protein